MMERIFNQCYKELVQFRRDRLILALAFVLPFMTLLIYGFAIRLESQNIPLIVQNFDRTNLSNNYVERLYATNQFVPTQWSVGEPIEQALDRGIAKVVVIIPPQFSRDLKAGRSTEVQVLIDATDVNNAAGIENSIQAITNFFMREQGISSYPNSIKSQTRLWFNPGRLESLYFVPGVYAVVLWIYPSLLAALSMVREKENGTLVQVYASGISANEFLLGKGLAYLLIAISQALLIMGMGNFIFQVSLVGEISTLLLGTLAFITNSVLFGLLIGLRSSNLAAAVQGVSLLGFMTSILLSGFIYPLNNIPFPLSLLPNIIPTRYYISITRDVFIRGIGWRGVWLDFICLIICGTILLVISRRVFRKMQQTF